MKTASFKAYDQKLIDNSNVFNAGFMKNPPLTLKMFKVNFKNITLNSDAVAKYGKPESWIIKSDDDKNGVDYVFFSVRKKKAARRENGA
jgi:hypothetical protein